MTVLDVLNAPWAITTAKLQQIQAIAIARLAGDGVDLEAAAQRLGRPLQNEQPKAYDVVDGVAIVSMDGVMGKRMNLFAAISGGCSTQVVANALLAADADSAVHSIILYTDSPGGTVDGTQNLADVYAGLSKPTATLANGSMCSAAYWVGSAGDRVYIEDTTTNVGSIGVVGGHTDISGAQEKQGIKTTEIYAGKYKRIASQYEPLTKAGRESIQDQVDYTYGLFVDAVAKNRKVSTDVVLADMADGRIFIGQQAVNAGLVDGITTMDALIAQLNTERATGTTTATKPAAKPNGQRAVVAPDTPPATPTTKPVTGASAMTPEELQEKHPETAAHFKNLGATAERARIAGIEAQSMPGHEKIISAMKADGTKTEADAAMAIVAAEKTQRANHAKNVQEDAPDALPAAAAPGADADKPAQPLTRADLDTKAKAYMAENKGVTYVQAVKHIEAQAKA